MFDRMLIYRRSLFFLFVCEFADTKQQAWNVFCLTYDVDTPINVVFHEEALNKVN